MCFAATAAHGGDAGAYVARWSRRSWQTRDGLPDGAVTSIVQLADGAMLVGTTGGAVRFDGVRMLPVATSDTTAVRGTLPPVEAVAISRCVGGDGSEWVGYAHGKVQRFVAGKVDTLGQSEGVIPSKPAHVVADTGGTVWLAQSGQLAEFRGDRFEQVAALPTGTVKVAVAPARDGGLWIKVDDPLFHHSTAEGLTVRAERSTGGVSTMFEDTAGRLWLGTDRSGMHVLSGTSVQQVPTVGSRVHAITQDREGGIWVGTSTALNRLWPSVAWRFSDGGSRPLRELITADDGSVWGITLQGEVGRVVIDARNPAAPPQPMSFFTSSTGWGGDLAETLCKDRHGAVWIGCRNGSIHRFLDGRFEAMPSPRVTTAQPEPVIRALVVTQSGDVWAATRAGVWRRAAAADSWSLVQLPSPPTATGTWGMLNRLVEDATGSVWAATIRGEIFRIAADGSRATRQTPPQLGGGAVVTAMHPLADGSVWIAVRDVGLFRFRGDTVRHVGNEAGLPATCVLAMAVDRGGRLWCICNRRVFAVATDELDRVCDGRQPSCHPWILAGVEENSFLDAIGDPQCAATVAGNGDVWLTLAQGLGVCSPDRLPLSSRVPVVEVEEVRVDGRVVASLVDRRRPGGWTDPIVIPPDPRTVEILYAPRTFAVPSNVVIERRLDGADTDWVRSGPRHVATYAGVRAGRYALHLRSSNERDVWTDPKAAVEIEVQPLLWERPWFRAATVASAVGLAALAGLAFATYRGRLKMETLRRQAALEAERVRIARDMHDELGTSLTQVALLADLARAEAPGGDASHLGNVVRISRELVRSMDELVWTVTPTNDTLPHLISYIGQSASDTLGQFGIACRVVGPHDVADLPASADFRRNVLLVVKEAVSNIVEHSGAETVEITIDVRGGQLLITIADDGRGIARPAADQGSRRISNGLENMRRRMAELGGTCRIRDVTPHGTAIDVTLPLKSSGKDLG